MVSAAAVVPVHGQAVFYQQRDRNSRYGDFHASSDGTILAYFSRHPWNPLMPNEIRRHDTGTRTDLDWASTDYWGIYAVSGDGSVVIAADSVPEGKQYYRDGVPFIPELIPGAVSYEVTHASAGPQVFGYCTMPNGSHRVTSWLGATATDLGLDGEVWTTSAEGLVVVGVSDGWVFRWENGLVDYIVEGSPKAINTDGSVIAGETAAGEGFRWRNGVLEEPLPNIDASRIRQITDDGEIIRVDLIVIPGSVLWQAGQFERFNDVYWMSNDGQILVGNDGLPFVYHNGVREYFVSPAHTQGGTAEVVAMSADGTVIVGQVDETVPAYSFVYSVPFLWTPEGGFESMCEYLANYGIIDPGPCGFPSDGPLWLTKGVSRNGRLLFGLYPIYGDAYGLFYIIIPRACSVADLTTQGAGPSSPLFGRPDEVVTAADLNYYVNDWFAQEPEADLTTANAPAGDPLCGVPDGAVTAADLLYFVNAWVEGCP